MCLSLLFIVTLPTAVQHPPLNSPVCLLYLNYWRCPFVIMTLLPRPETIVSLFKNVMERVFLNSRIFNFWLITSSDLRRLLLSRWICGVVCHLAVDSEYSTTGGPRCLVLATQNPADQYLQAFNEAIAWMTFTRCVALPTDVFYWLHGSGRQNLSHMY